MTVKEFIEQNPDATLDMMTPVGFLQFTPEQVAELFQCECVNAHPGDRESWAKVTMEELLQQEILHRKPHPHIPNYYYIFTAQVQEHGKEISQFAGTMQAKCWRGQHPFDWNDIAFEQEIIESDGSLNFYVPIYFDAYGIFGDAVIKENLTVIFKKVKGHSGDKYNDMADALAKTALGIGTVEGIDKTEKKVRPMSVYITRNKEKLQELLNATAAELWEEVQTHTIQNVGQQLRFEFTVNNKTAKLDIYQRADGTTTFYPTGRNTELSNQLRDALESRAYPTTAEVKSYSLVIGAEWVQKTVEFLKSLCSGDDGSCEEHEDNGHTRHTFNSPIGDKLTITVLSPGKILLQGKPLFLYNELISFVSHSPKVEMHDIIQATNEVVETKTDVDTTRRKLQDLMPNAYAGSVDDTIWKVFSPSMAMLDMDNELEDYSCCMFPALRALEGFLLFLLDEKNVVIDEK